MKLLEPLAGLKTQLGHILMHIIFFSVQCYLTNSQDYKDILKI
jgi:hypothetical protein